MKFTLLFLPLFVFHLGEQCSFKATHEKYPKPQGIWDEAESLRLNSLIDCACGTGINEEGKDKPWNLFIRPDPSSPEIICSGTIITSNLIVTSHHCLTKPGRNMNVYDIWARGEHANMFAKDAMIVSTSIEEPSSEVFQVEDVIYHPYFAFSSALHRTLRNDIALIRLRADFTAHAKLHPICIPTNKDKRLDILHQPAFYHGAGKGNGSRPLREIRKTLAGIQPGKECDEELEIRPENVSKPIDDDDDRLCLSFLNMPDGSPSVPGGPLTLITGEGETQQTFLLGIATTVEELGPQGIYEYTYFSSIMPLIKYLEFIAATHGSVWCVTPPLTLQPKIEAKPSGKFGPWPWESLKRPVPRNESLDCDCGVPNTEMGGRVVGGVTATPYEFGWMTLLHMFPDGRQRGAFLCGGAIINDRLILTAAHCLVSDKKIKHKERKVAVGKDYVDVTINVHSRKNDPKGIRKKVAAVLYHPDYIEPRRQHYYDFDIGLLALQEPLVFSPTGESGIRPICLPELDNAIDVIGRTATVAGWGLVDPEDFGSAAEKLQKLQVPIANLSMCRDVAHAKVTDNFLCAGTLNRYKDSASGDSGGPLMIQNDKKQWLEVGIVSWGEDSLREGVIETAALYTNVQKLLQFVDYHSTRLSAQWCRSKNL